MQNVVYLSDIPNADGLTGSLFLFTLPNVGSQNPTIVRTDVGRIDYINGIIVINAINIISGIEKDGQQVIEIQATPTSNDIVGLQDLYLQLDINNSSFEMISDQIARESTHLHQTILFLLLIVEAIWSEQVNQL